MSELLTVKVARKREEALGICSFELVDPQGDLLPAFEAGAHIDVHVDDSLCRQYSLCNDPAERHRYLIGVLDEPKSRGGSRAMHASVREGDLLRISQPRNLFRLDPQAPRSLLLAGGIGVTPILAMAEQLARAGADFRMHYSGRTATRMAFVDRIRGGRLAAHAEIHMDDGPPEQRLDITATLATAPRDAHIYACGPAGFIQAVADHARQAGWPSNHVHFEYFAATQTPTTQDAEAFEVRIASSGQVIAVQAGESVVAALARHGIGIPTSCEQGICGTCITGVLEGEPEHRDMVLSDDERAQNTQFLPCCSRSRSRLLVLDL